MILNLHNYKSFHMLGGPGNYLNSIKLHMYTIDRENFSSIKSKLLTKMLTLPKV